MAFLEKEAEHLTKVVPCWEEALNSLSLVFSEPLELPEYGQISLQKLWEIAKFRSERLRKIGLSIMPQAMPYVYDISNLDKSQMKAQLHTLAKGVGLSLDLPKTLEFAHIREAVRELQQFIEHLDPSYSDEGLCSARHALDAFFGVTLQYHEHNCIKRLP